MVHPPRVLVGIGVAVVLEPLLDRLARLSHIQRLCREAGVVVKCRVGPAQGFPTPCSGVHVKGIDPTVPQFGRGRLEDLRGVRLDSLEEGNVGHVEWG